MQNQDTAQAQVRLGRRLLPKLALCAIFATLACYSRNQIATLEIPPGFHGPVTVKLCDSSATESAHVAIDERGFGASRLCPQSRSQISFVIRQGGAILHPAQNLQMQTTGDGITVSGELQFSVP